QAQQLQNERPGLPHPLAAALVLYPARIYPNTQRRKDLFAFRAVEQVECRDAAAQHCQEPKKFSRRQVKKEHCLLRQVVGAKFSSWRCAPTLRLSHSCRWTIHVGEIGVESSLDAGTHECVRYS